MKTLFTFLMVQLFVLGAQAETPRLYKPQYQCPKAHAEYKQILTQLKDLKSKLENMGCKDSSITEQLSEITQMITNHRQDFLRLISEKQEGVLTAEEAETVRNYVSGLTEKVSSIVGLAMLNNGRSGFWPWSQRQCALDEASKYAVISQTSTLVYEATNLVSKVAGPYGVPIAIGGNLLSGLIKGVGSFLEDAENINFHDEGKRLFYAETLCIYHQYDLEVRQLMNPGKHLASLERLRTFLQNKVNELGSNCSQCGDAITQFRSSGGNIKKLDPNLFTTINQNPDYSSDELGSETKEALTSLKWVEEEIDRFTSIVNFPTQGLEPGEVQSLRTRIKTFMETSAVAFLRWFQFNELPGRKSSLEKSINLLQPEANDNPQYNLAGSRDRALPPYLRKLVFISDNADLYKKTPRFFTEVQWVYDQWKIMEKRFQALLEYCDFYRQAFMYPADVEKKCQETNPILRKYAEQVAIGSLSLAFLVENDDFPQGLGPHDLSKEIYLSILGSAPAYYKGEISTDYDLIIKKKTLGGPGEGVGGQNQTHLFESWEEQMEAQIDAWERGKEERYQRPDFQ